MRPASTNALCTRLRRSTCLSGCAIMTTSSRRARRLLQLEPPCLNQAGAGSGVMKPGVKPRLEAFIPDSGSNNNASAGLSQVPRRRFASSLLRPPGYFRVSGPRDRRRTSTQATLTFLYPFYSQVMSAQPPGLWRLNQRRSAAARPCRGKFACQLLPLWLLLVGTR